MFCRLTKHRLSTCLASLCLLLMLAGCGQKGPLYLPDETEQEQTDESES